MRFAPALFLLALWVASEPGFALQPPARKGNLERAVPEALTPAPAITPQVEQKPTPAPVDQSAQLVVIGYHRVVDKVRHPDTEITPKDFEMQMQQIRDAGISVISMKDFLAWRRGERNIPPRSAIITFDDGWKSTYEVAWPILKKFGYPFALFIYTHYVKGGPKSGGGSLTWGQLAELRDAGADIESHTVSHHDLRGGKRRGTPEYEAWLWEELAGSKQKLERELGILVEALALPYGYHDEHVRETAKKAGYQAIFTVEGRKITYSTPLESVGRYIIDSSKPQLFAAAIRFNGPPTGNAGSPLVTAINPSTIETQPPDGATVSEQFPLLQANLAPFGDIDPKSVQMRISGFGLVPADYDAAAKIVSFKLQQNLQEKVYVVIVSLQADGRRMETRWTFKYSRAPKADAPETGGPTP